MIWSSAAVTTLFNQKTQSHFLIVICMIWSIVAVTTLFNQKTSITFPNFYLYDLIYCSCDYTFQSENFNHISSEAKEFISSLLVLSPEVSYYSTSTYSSNQCCGSGSELDPYSGASWIRICIRNTDLDPHMQI